MDCTDIHALPAELADRIPAELILHILDEAGYDHATLCTCLRVCQAWYALLIPRLYESIRLHDHAELDKLASAARAHPAVRARLASTRTMTLSRRARPDNRLARAFPLVLGPYLCGVAHLVFRTSLLYLAHPSFFAALRQLTNVRRLDLVKFHLGSFYQLQRVLCAFPLLEEVHLQQGSMRCRMNQHNVPLILNPQGPWTLLRAPRLSVLRVNRLQADVLRDLVSWTSATSCLASIKVLDIIHYLWHNDNADPAIALIAQTAMVEHLRLRHTSFGEQPIVAAGPSYLHQPRSAGIGSRLCHGFERCTHLRTLDVTLLYPLVVRSRDIMQGLHDILSSLASPTLQTIRVKLDVDDVVVPSGDGYQVQDVASDAKADAVLRKALHVVLSRPVFAHLTGATIILTTYHETPKDARHLVEAILALLRALFAPWRPTRRGERDIATLVGGVWGFGRYCGAVDAGVGEETRWLSGEMDKYAENPLLASLGL